MRRKVYSFGIRLNSATTGQGRHTISLGCERKNMLMVNITYVSIQQTQVLLARTSTAGKVGESPSVVFAGWAMG
jgi:hypothetical protein